jgi:hypothetical protein
MEDKRGEFYSNGYCTAFEEDCKNNLKGACGICTIGGKYRNLLSRIESLGNNISQLRDDYQNLKT